MTEMNEREKLINFGKQKLLISPLSVGWLKFLIRVFPVLFAVFCGAGIILNSVTVFTAFSDEVTKALSDDKIAAIIVVSAVCIAIYLTFIVYSIVMYRRTPLLTEQIRAELKIYLILCAVAFLLTEVSSNLMKVYVFPEKSNIESTLTYCGFVAVALIAFVIMNLRYLKKRSYIFLDSSYYEDEFKKTAKKKKHKKK